MSPAAVCARSLVVTGQDSDEHAGRNGANRHAANYRQQPQADTAVNASTKNESGHTGDRQSGERLVPDVLGHIPVARRAIG
jgi:hypothetical protein